MSKKISLSLMLLFAGIQLSFHSQIVKATTPTIQATSNKSTCPAQLNTSIEAVINRPIFNRVRWGILVQSQTSGKTLYSRDSEKFFIPASNTKLFTTAAALLQLGEKFRFRTSIYQNSPGVLRVVGRGDPSLNNQQLQLLAQKLKQQNINEIKLLIADDSYVKGDIVHPTWEWEDVQADYGAPSGSFILNENTFSLQVLPETVGKTTKILWDDNSESQRWRVMNQSATVDKNQPNYINVSRSLSAPTLTFTGQIAADSQPYKVTLPVVDPSYFFLRRFRNILATENITLGQTTVFSGGINQQEVAFVESPPLSELITETNVVSNNVYAEALLRALAVKRTGTINQSSANLGLEVVRETLTQLGVNPNSYFIADGSGLSRRNLISPEAVVATLQGMAKTPVGQIYKASLPVAGKNGTLTRRFINTPAAEIVHAKTGTLTGASSLSGYVKPPNYEPLVFSIMVNQADQSATVLRQAIDEIVLLLTQLQSC